MNFASGRQGEHVLYGVIAALTVLPFVADLLVPLGTAVWVIYLLPCALAYNVWRPQVPLLVAATATVFVFLGYTLANPGINPELAAINRTFGVLTCWIIGITGYFFIRNKLDVKQQDWLQAGQVGLASAMSGEQRIDQLGENALRFLADYLGAQSGAMFVQDGLNFRRAATFGVPAGAPVPEQFDLQDGLLGRAAKDKRRINLSDVPDDYLYFGSGLGRGKPRQLIIAPASADGHVNAVIELGFTGTINESEAALMDRVSDAIGVAVRSAKYRTRLQELLEETQRQTEELQAQSEELRSANEELGEQSRSLQDSQTRLEAQQAELEQTNAQLEEQTQLLETQRDELSLAQASLQRQTRDLEQASRYKSEFLANMSHELRTPLNSLLIMAKLLGDNRGGNLSAEQVKYANTIEGSGNDLLVLINDILDISKIEAGHVDLQPEHVHTEVVIGRLTTAFQPLAQQKGLAFRTEIGPDAARDIKTDPQRLEQVLKNFISNAIKFTDGGEVVVSIGRATDGRVAFAVRDTGIGIPPEQQHVIFEAFRQADGTINRKYGGTGLGLSISRELARLLGGEIRVDSAVGHGSTFSLLIPEVYSADLVRPRQAGSLPHAIAAPAPMVARPVAPMPAVPRRSGGIKDDRESLSGNSGVILVVEDDRTFAKVLYDLAHELGLQCLAAGTADEGVLLARQYLPQAVILDVGLPDHTGLSVLDRLKRDIRTRHIPVHVISADDYTQAAMLFGAASYMVKPVKREQLTQALEGMELRLQRRMRRVLIVEDKAEQLESLRSLLGSRDVDTTGAQTAADALERLKSETFDCMVLDLSLPDMSGFDFLEQLSHDESTSFPPVIVYTGRSLSADEELQLRKYSKSIIIKGAKSPERLLDEVTLFLHQVVSELPEKQQQLVAKSLNRDAALEGRRILVVEDDVRNVFALTGIFEPHGAMVEIARNGRESLDVLDRTTGTDGAIDLVLMDVMMPEMDGLTATREIRRRDEWRNLPIIALTAKAMPDDQEQCLAAGANDYLAKPLDVDKLLSLVRVWMPR